MIRRGKYQALGTLIGGLTIAFGTAAGCTVSFEKIDGRDGGATLGDAQADAITPATGGSGGSGGSGGAEAGAPEAAAPEAGVQDAGVPEAGPTVTDCTALDADVVVGTVSEEITVNILVEAAVQAARTARELRAMLHAACSGIAQAGGDTPIDAANPTDPTDAEVADVCDGAQAVLERENPTHLAIAESGGYCFVDGAAQLECEARCDVHGVCSESLEERCATPTCSACSGTTLCLGTAAAPIQCEAHCTGICNGPCRTGFCTEENLAGDCEGHCTGICEGTCAGTCESGDCDGAGLCLSGCVEPHDTSRCGALITTTCLARVECHRLCAHTAVLARTCTPLSLDLVTASTAAFETTVAPHLAAVFELGTSVPNNVPPSLTNLRRSWAGPTAASLADTLNRVSDDAAPEDAGCIMAARDLIHSARDSLQATVSTSVNLAQLVGRANPQMCRAHAETHGQNASDPAGCDAGCTCEHCFQQYVDCSNDEDCMSILDCVLTTGCRGVSCLLPCQDVIDAAGGPFAPSAQLALDLEECADAAGCCTSQDEDAGADPGPDAAPGPTDAGWAGD